MVEDRVTDGRRVGQLLASELTGLERGPLADVALTDADEDAEPSADGTLAYRVAHRGDAVGHVDLYPEGVTLTLAVTGEAATAAVAAASDHDLPVAQRAGETAPVVVTVPDGARVKRAVDVVVAALSAR